MKLIEQNCTSRGIKPKGQAFYADTGQNDP